MIASKVAIELIKKYEGCRLSAYRCPAGIWTIGYGHTLGVRSGDTITKDQAEEYLIKWAEENGVILGILRPSLMVGPNPPGNLKAMINGIKKGYYVNIAGGHTRKSLMMIHDIAHLVPKIENVGGIYNVCDNSHPSYKELSDSISKQLGKKLKPLSIPYWMAWCLAKVGDLVGVLPIDSHRLEQLTKSNTYSNEKAKKALKWEPMDVISNFKIV